MTTYMSSASFVFGLQPGPPGRKMPPPYEPHATCGGVWLYQQVESDRWPEWMDLRVGLTSGSCSTCPSCIGGPWDTAVCAVATRTGAPQTWRCGTRFNLMNLHDVLYSGTIATPRGTTLPHADITRPGCGPLMPRRAEQQFLKLGGRGTVAGSARRSFCSRARSCRKPTARLASEPRA